MPYSVSVNNASSCSEDDVTDDDAADDEFLDDDNASQTEQETIANYHNRYARRRSRTVLCQLSGTYKKKHQKKLQLNNKVRVRVSGARTNIKYKCEYQT